MNGIENFSAAAQCAQSGKNSNLAENHCHDSLFYHNLSCRELSMQIRIVVQILEQFPSGRFSDFHLDFYEYKQNLQNFKHQSRCNISK